MIGQLKSAVHGQTLVLTISNPSLRNALGPEIYTAGIEALNAAESNPEIRSVIITGEGAHFCAGGNLQRLLTNREQPKEVQAQSIDGLHTWMEAIHTFPKPVIAAVEGVCAGAGAIIAMASDLRYATPDARTAFLFTRVGLAGADMGACALLPRVIGQGRASELLFTGRAMNAQEGLAWGFFNALHDSAELLPKAQALAAELAAGPTFAHGMTKTMLQQEWAMTIEQAVEAEAQAQAICMQTKDFHRAYNAFAAKQKPVFGGD